MLRLEVAPMAAQGRLRVLWATDGSRNSQNAFPLLRQMVLPVTEKLVVLTVAPRSVLTGARPDPAFIARARPSVKQRELTEARQTAEREATALDPDVPVEAVSRWGHPIEEILRVANQMKADLIVMAAKGHSNLRLVLLGSVTQGVAQHATRPLLIARPGTEAVRKVLLGYHGSAAAKKALAHLNRLALPADAEIVVVTAVEPFTLPEGMPPGYRQQALAEAHRINERRHKAAGRALAELAARIKATGRAVSTEVTSGPAAQVLDQAARVHRADLIVVGSRKPAPERHYLLGSTAEKLVRHSHTSVLVVR
jgi:nucleotide-binding universal stress UspA family protein